MVRIKAWRWISGLLIVLAGCSSAPDRGFMDHELLIDQSVMPSNWSMIKYVESNDFDEGEESGAYVNFKFEDTPYLVRAGEDIYHYSNSKRADWHYQRFESGYFSDENVFSTTPWQTPDDFEFASSFARQWRYACAGSNFTFGDISGETRTICQYFAQYEEFVVTFFITIEVDDQVFISSQQPIEDILEAIDERMGEYLFP